MRLVQLVFGGGTMPEEMTMVTMVLLLKGKGGYWRIGVVEVLWKVCSIFVNCCLKRGVVLYDALHGFREGHGTGMATLEANLEQYLSGFAHEPLFQVFLDFLKAYNLLERGRCLEILRGYGLGPNLTLLLKNYWKQHRIVSNLVKCLRTSFKTGRGVT